MIGWISVALIWRISARISETAPGRTPLPAARPPLVLPGFCSPRSIILTSSMATSFPNFRNDCNSDYPKSSLTLISEYQKLEHNGNVGVSGNAIHLGSGTFASAARVSRQGHVLFGNRRRAQREVRNRLFPQCRDRPRQTPGLS